MNTTPSPDRAAPDHLHTEARAGAGSFTEVLVYAGVLRTTAEMLGMLHDFLSDADPAVRAHLDRFLIACHPDEEAGDPSIEAATLLNEVTEAVDLLHALAGDIRDGPPV